MAVKKASSSLIKSCFVRIKRDGIGHCSTGSFVVCRDSGQFFDRKRRFSFGYKVI